MFEDDKPLRFERIVLYPYPELDKIWARVWLPAVQDQMPNVEIRVLNPDGTENNSVYLMARTEQRIETTLHVRRPIPGATYHVIAELSRGFAEPEILDRQEFDLILEFRNPQTKAPGFGMGVDWDELSQGAQEL